jgi:hypothetical protein
MRGGEYDYDQVARAGDPAAAVARLHDDELAALLRYAEGLMRQNDTNGGWPATTKWLCVFEGAKRFFQKTQDGKTQDTRAEV